MLKINDWLQQKLDSMLENSNHTKKLIEEQSKQYEELKCCIEELESKIDDLKKSIDALNLNKSEPKVVSGDEFKLQQMATGDNRVNDVYTQDNPSNIFKQRKLFANSYSSYSPLGFLEADLAETYQGQLYVIEQISETEATYAINDDLDFSFLISNYKYGYKDITTLSEKTDNPSSVRVVEKGKLELKSGVWGIKEKSIIKIL